jgi:polysaccharide export outer membrane protein
MRVQVWSGASRLSLGAVLTWPLLPLLLGACSHFPEHEVVQLPAPAATVATPEPAYALAIGDELTVRFPHQFEMSENLVIPPDGRISLPLIGEVVVLRRALPDVQAELRRRYASLEYDPATQPGDKRYFISSSDELEIRFREAREFDNTVIVRPDGKISLPLVKTVHAEGKTPEQLEAELIEGYRRFLKEPDLVVIVRKFTTDRYRVGSGSARPGAKNLDDVTVIVKSVAPRFVFVGGEVARPGAIPYSADLSTLRAIVSAGGALRSAQLGHVLVLRKAAAEPPTATFLNLRSDLAAQRINDLPLRPWDVVMVPKTTIVKVNDFVDQYLYQLIRPAANSNFTFFYNMKSNNPVIP